MKHILIVDPSEHVAQIIKEYLEADNLLHVMVAHSAQDGVHAADTQIPDVVILELAIPMHNGFAFLHEFRSYDDWAKIPVIIHSHIARDEATMSKSWQTLGAAEYFYKPTTTLAALKASVYKVLDI